MKSIRKVYDILNDIVKDTSAYKVAISKTCYMCDEPYAEMVYDNKVSNEERYNSKFNRVPIDESVVQELHIVAKGRVIADNVADLPNGMKKEIYTAEGIVYSETHKIIMVDQYLYVMVIHYRIPFDEVGDGEIDIINRHKRRLIKIFEDNRNKL